MCKLMNRAIGDPFDGCKTHNSQAGSLAQRAPENLGDFLSLSVYPSWRNERISDFGMHEQTDLVDLWTIHSFTSRRDLSVRIFQIQKFVPKSGCHGESASLRCGWNSDPLYMDGVHRQIFYIILHNCPISVTTNDLSVIYRFCKRPRHRNECKFTPFWIIRRSK